MSERIRFKLNGKELSARAGQSVLSSALEQGHHIPHLCYAEGLSSGGGCSLCLMEVRGMPRLLRACSTAPWEGMEARTDTEKVQRAREGALALLLGDHRGDCLAPCTLSCPAHIDCQSFIRRVAAGDMPGAYDVLMKALPLPGSVGLVCGEPCRRACRRGLVDRPLSLRQLQVLAAEESRAAARSRQPDRAEATGKRVVVVGGGACGLTAAWFLAMDGHEVTVLDKKSYMGGGLRDALSGRPDAQALLDWEIEQIAAAGVKLAVERTVSAADLDALRGQYDAVLLTLGEPRQGGDNPVLDGGFNSLGNGIFSARSRSGSAAAAAGHGASAAAEVNAYLTGKAVKKKPAPRSRRRIAAGSFDAAELPADAEPGCDRPVIASPEQEAGRCMSCGCGAYPDCALLRCADELSVRQPDLGCAAPARRPQPRPGGMIYDRDKCILCGICVRACGETAGHGLLSFAGRGSASGILALFDGQDGDEPCSACLRCEELCPTGALLHRKD